ncbi:helix-turn-helix transcriptional regulator [Chengkuizengella sp. SCS-71B]|uniref:helix-turn-helix domain-containing protein n=1 Tax=Chengkuizengella sp. SCS-71B TaxID=3115290 RepID=UPI0032C217FC
MITTTYSSLGELIRYHRKQAEMTIVQLEQLTNVDKAVISRIETGQTKRPNLENILKIGVILKIPYEKIMDLYIDNEERLEVLFSVLNDFIQESNFGLITKLGEKILSSPTENSIDLVEILFEKTKSIKEPSVRLSLYKLVISYSRAHGIMPYIAKGLMQSYFIERDDFTKLRSTFSSGKSVLFFEDFLTSEEKGLIYCKLGVHAYYICLFEESVELNKKALEEKITDTRMLANTIGSLSNGYYRLGDYKQSKAYLDKYKTFPLPEVKDNTKLNESMLHSANGNHQLAIAILQENLLHFGDNALLHVVNQLIKIYLQIKNLSAIEELLQLEEKILSIKQVTPFKKSELAYYFRLKGDYYILRNRVEEGIKFYLEAANRYAMIDLIEKEKECLREIMNTHESNREIDVFKTIEKLKIHLTKKEG